MPFFHGTLRSRLPLILRYGLGGVDIGPNAEECERGVYLASDPRLSIAVLVAQFLANADDDTSPRDEVEQFTIIVIDDARIDRRKLVSDPQVTKWRGSWLYRGVIDVTNAPLLTTDEVYQGWHYKPEDVGWIDIPK